jgi:predicted component of type VI protein secretion system
MLESHTIVRAHIVRLLLTRALALRLVDEYVCKVIEYGLNGLCRVRRQLSVF